MGKRSFENIRGISRPEKRSALFLKTGIKSGEIVGLLEISGAMALAGSSIVVAKILSVRIPVFLSAELSLCAALVAILPLQIVRWREFINLSLHELRYMFLQALFGIVLFRVLTLYGLHFTSAIHAGIITSVAPAVMAVFAGLFLKERLNLNCAIGIVLTIGGLFSINLYGLRAMPSHGFLLGNLLIGCATACEALLTIFRKSSGGKISSVTNTTVLVGMSIIMLLPFSLFELGSFNLTQIKITGWVAIIYYGAVATIIAYILWGDGSLRISANRTGLALSVMPLSALLLSALILKEELSLVHVAGCLLIISGIVIGRK